MIHIKQYILTLVALIGLTAQAWAADELSETLTTNTSQTTYSGEHFTITGQRADAYGFYIVGLNDAMQIPNTVTISSKNGENITRIEAVIGYLHDQWNNNDNIVSTSGDVTGTYSEGQTLTISPVNATTVTLSSSQANYHLIEIKTWKIYYTPPPFPITWDATTPNTASIDAMPAGNVTVSVEYYPQAALTTVPSAKSGVKATTDDDIINAGTVDAIGSTETKQGTLLYHVSDTQLTEAQLEALTDADWSADVPKATGITEAGTYYVYYYVKGNVGQTDDTIFSDGDYNDHQTDNLPIEVEIGEAPTYDVTFAEGTNLNEWSASPNTGITKGTEVTVTYSGDRKVIGVKAEKKSASTPLDDATTAWTAGTYAVPAGGLTYSDAITVSGDVTLVLTDGETLILNKGISIADGATLTIQGNGTMNVNGTKNSTASTVAGTGTLVLTSGTLNAKGGNGAGLGNSTSGADMRAYAGGNAINGNVTVSGGTLTATGGNGGVVGEISSYSYGAAGGTAISGSVTVTGGAVTATGGNGGSIGSNTHDAYGGNGGAAIGGDATLTGGTWTATDGTHGANNGGQGGAGGKAVAGTVTDNR